MKFKNTFSTVLAVAGLLSVIRGNAMSPGKVVAPGCYNRGYLELPGQWQNITTYDTSKGSITIPQNDFVDTLNLCTFALQNQPFGDDVTPSLAELKALNNIRAYDLTLLQAAYAGRDDIIIPIIGKASQDARRLSCRIGMSRSNIKNLFLPYVSSTECQNAPKVSPPYIALPPRVGSATITGQ